MTRFEQLIGGFQHVLEVELLFLLVNELAKLAFTVLQSIAEFLCFKVIFETIGIYPSIVPLIAAKSAKLLCKFFDIDGLQPLGKRGMVADSLKWVIRRLFSRTRLLRSVRLDRLLHVVDAWDLGRGDFVAWRCLHEWNCLILHSLEIVVVVV